MTKIVKRFIAGAVCPNCAAMDTMQMYKEDGDEVRECVECGFKDVMRFKQNVNELETRVNKTEEQIAAETQVIKFPSEKDE